MATAQTFIGRKRVRKFFFGKIQEVAEMPNLIEVQKASYDQFLQIAEPTGGRPDEGLQTVFKSVFPISDFSNASMLEFVKYEFEVAEIRRQQCRQRGIAPPPLFSQGAGCAGISIPSLTRGIAPSPKVRGAERRKARVTFQTPCGARPVT